MSSNTTNKSIESCEKAARLKARFPIALADAFAVQVAREKDVVLVTGDPEIRAVEKAGEVRVTWISR